MNVEITPRSLALLTDYWLDAPNWSGEPLVGGNLGGSREDRGNLTQLKQAGLITTFNDGGDVWIQFTELGTATAKAEATRRGVSTDYDDQARS